MKPTTFFTFIVAVASVAQVANLHAAPPAIGDVIADLRFKDIRALPRSLTDLGAKKAVSYTHLRAHET
jgi:hypothetical protein